MTPRAGRKKNQGPGLKALGPLCIAFLAGALVIFLVLGGLDRLKPGPGSSSEGGLSAAELRERAGALAALLLPQAAWDVRDEALPMEWVGTLPASQSLVQWNARISAGVQSLGLEVMEGYEEIVPRPSQWPLQRLTLVVGGAGEKLATIVVESPRSPSRPPAF